MTMNPKSYLLPTIIVCGTILTAVLIFSIVYPKVTSHEAEKSRQQVIEEIERINTQEEYQRTWEESNRVMREYEAMKGNL